MSLTSEQLQALGLSADATAEQVSARIAELSKPQSADSGWQAAVAKLEAVIAGLKPAAPAPAPAVNAQASEAHLIAVNAVVDAAVSAGKIAPASKASFVTLGGTTVEALKALQATVATLPVLVSTNAKDHTPPKGAPKTDGLTDNQRKIAAALGVSAEEFLKGRSEL